MYILRRKENKDHYYRGPGMFVLDITESAQWRSAKRADEWIKFNRRFDLEVVDEKTLMSPNVDNRQGW